MLERILDLAVYLMCLGIVLWFLLEVVAFFFGSFVLLGLAFALRRGRRAAPAPTTSAPRPPPPSADEE